MIIDTKKSKYNLNNESNREIALMPEGIITGYSDELSGQFLIIKLRSNIEIKVSENELSECTRTYYFSRNTPFLNLLKSIKNHLKIQYILSGNKEIKYLLNPITFFKWIMYTIKDIL